MIWLRCLKLNLLASAEGGHTPRFKIFEKNVDFWKLKEIERFGSFLTKNSDFESQNFAFFGNFYSTDCKT